MLTPDQLEAYRRDGFIHVRGLLSPEEAAAYRAEVHAIAAQTAATDATWASVKGETRLTHCHDVQFRSAAFTRLLVDPRFLAVATAIIGPNVQLHHTKMFVKPPENGSPFPMHQDFPYFPHRDHSMIACILHFDDAPDEKGCLRVYPGSHLRGPLPAEGDDPTCRRPSSRLWALPPSRPGRATRSSSPTSSPMARASTARTSRARPCWCSSATPPIRPCERAMAAAGRG